MASRRSSQVSLFLFAILAALSSHVEKVSAANWVCPAGELERILPDVCPTCLSCTDWCASQGRPLVTKEECVDKETQPKAIWHYCVCCCGGPPASPPPPPPFPPPPQPRDPRDLCFASEISLSSATISCVPNNCPVCSCGPGVVPTEISCVNDYCNCCCP
ncbi:hypothetical protein MKX01_028216 [Papaver californicum]|nr:hypothetical protein MKX01_028216 [Papaver californicum]